MNPGAAARLTYALESVGAPAEMISLARAGYYGDFTSPLSFPILRLVADARAAGLERIAARAMLGDFDGE